MTEAATVPAAGAAAQRGRGSPDHPAVAEHPRAAATKWRSWCRTGASSTSWCRWRPRMPPRPCARSQAQWQADTNHQSEALAELQEALDLPSPPNRIECYDISNTQGTAAVGSMVVFEQGVPSKKALPALQHPERHGTGRFRQHGRGAHPPLPAAGRPPRRLQTRRARSPIRPSPCCRTC